MFTDTNASPEDQAVQAIRDFCGWHIAPITTETLILDGTGTDTLLLPSRRVIDLKDLKVLDEPLDLSAYEWSEAGIVRRRNGLWPKRYRSISLTITHGFSDVGALVGIAQAVTERIRADRTGSVVSQRAGTQSVTWGPRGSGGGCLLEAERYALEPYRLTWGC
ncbi:hypothetical protein [Devriesea agamarum]|uniref:hypothetical protein n=1 Tax=Devriesea agamarum TaxID=472569 RepID=UPI00071DFDF7|nr:hypothetical protein [Devriesea agamarum]